MLRLKRVLMGALAEQGVERAIPPDGPAVRMIDQEMVRGLFYGQTPADGTPKQKRQSGTGNSSGRWIGPKQEQLIGGREIDDVDLPAPVPATRGGRQ